MSDQSQGIDNAVGARAQLTTAHGTTYSYYRLERLIELGMLDSIDRLPFTVRILLENLLRNIGGEFVEQIHLEALAKWQPSRNPAGNDTELPFLPARVVLQDFTGVPCVVDLAAMRSAMHTLGGDVTKINPLVPVDLVIDHSVQVDNFGTLAAFGHNVEREYERNGERYELLRWAQRAFQNFRVVPPGTGIVHQVNLEYLAPVVATRETSHGHVAFPDTLVGTDSHTTMINALGVLGYGVGGIEAEAVMLGQPMYQLMPEVVGLKFTGGMNPGTTATDLVLAVTELLRKHGVVGRFVEFCGTGLSNLSLADRATIANMAPEYGATAGLFPIDDETLRYLHLTGREDDHVSLVERYSKEQGLFRTDETPDPQFNELLELDLASIEPSLAGPRRPQDRIALAGVQGVFRDAYDTVFTAEGDGHDIDDNGYDEQSMESFPASDPPAAMAGATEEGRIPGESAAAQVATARDATLALAERPTGSEHVGDVSIRVEDMEVDLHHGSVVIAAITSCTNTSNPSVMLGAGLLAKKAVERGLDVPPYVKTSLAPGSQVVTRYLDEAGVTPYLEALGFHVVGFGCTTCIGNSGPLPQVVANAVDENELVVASVLSGNRNFEGRIHPQVRASFLASPPLVVAYALAGTVDIDLTTDPLGTDPNGEDVYLADIWPTEQDVLDAIASSVHPAMFREEYATVFAGDERWQNLPIPEGNLYEWNKESTYVQEPPFFVDMAPEPAPIEDISGARVLALVGDSVTTDHISPAGAIARTSPAGQYLQNYDVNPRDFNSYGSRRGNHEVMIRGTFANIRLRNQLAEGKEGNWTKYFPTGEIIPVFDASMYYQEAGIPLIVIAGKEYGTGSSRDWAAKGTLLLGAKAVIAESFERIHRSNLVGMGVLPLQFLPGENAASLGLTGEETYEIRNIDAQLAPKAEIAIDVTRADGSSFSFKAIARVDSNVDVRYYRNGGILPTVLRRLMSA
jgi:aconitate hydratase